MGAVVQLWDGLKNAITGAGTSRDARMANSYGIARSLTQQEIDAAYRGSGLMRKIIQIPALDMVREWRDWKLETDQITAVEAEEKRLNVRGKIRQAEVLRRLGGGALILGLPGSDLSLPAPQSVAKQGLAFVHVVSRWHLNYDQLEDDARLPGYGEPRMWRLNSGTGRQDIHPSRVIAFRADTSGMLAAVSLNSDDAFWGESTVQQVIDAVKDSDAARAAFSALLHKARLLRVGIPGLSNTLAGPGGTAQVQARIEMLALGESIHNATIYEAAGTDGKGGEAIQDAQYNFAGAKDLLNAYGEWAAAISDIPATRLLGRAPEGMNASGDSQQVDWRKKVRAMQTLELAPCLDRLDRYLLPSALGTVPDGQWYEFAPLDQPTEKEAADTFFTLMQGVEKLSNLAAIPEPAFNRGVQSLMVDLGTLPELEQALAEIPEDERWGIVTAPDALDDPNAAEGGDPASAGVGGSDPVGEPPRRAANDAITPPAEPHVFNITVPVEVHLPKGGATRTTVTKHTEDGRIAEFEKREIEE